VNKLPIIIAGSGGHAVSVADLAISVGFSPVMFVDANSDRREIHGIPVLPDFDSLSKDTSHSCALAIGDNYQRSRVLETIKVSHPQLDFPTLIHKDTTIGSWSEIEKGSLIFPGSRIGANCRIGQFAIVNTSATLDHDSTLEEFASLAPGVTTGGKVWIGSFSAVGLGAVVKHGVKIQSHTVIGAASNVLKDFEGHGVVFGNPAEWVRGRQIGDPYL